MTFAGAVLVTFSFTACAEKQQEASGTAQDQHEEMDHSGMNHSEMAAKVVVETPDYTSVAEPVKAQVAALVDSYLRLKDALVASSAKTAKAEAEAVLAAAEKIDLAALEGDQKEFAQEKLGEVKQSASRIAAANDIGAQREGLELLSEATFSLTKAFGATDQKLYYQHCPMANNNQGAYWLSSNQEIRNPYFGEQMLKCGSTEESIN
ncbi:DUF3347 domain-containing protein [Pontibacter qinzhouensis]|uniref:DUF3347 domain-containing protein n=1 Tax=Pontibacter qinzhouensis TaxID=2603253 RepID=A0A5C8K895_9BACT|nr:DUF3347 domain-containing protein [Pontibacter qinzhouensis]TXK45869.1 DUF3347 domain-containing protein [Pontibacter qinzhouensis]